MAFLVLADRLELLLLVLWLLLLILLLLVFLPEEDFLGIHKLAQHNI